MKRNIGINDTLDLYISLLVFRRDKIELFLLILLIK